MPIGQNIYKQGKLHAHSFNIITYTKPGAKTYLHISVHAKKVTYRTSEVFAQSILLRRPYEARGCPLPCILTVTPSLARVPSRYTLTTRAKKRRFRVGFLATDFSYLSSPNDISWLCEVPRGRFYPYPPLTGTRQLSYK